MNKEVKMTFDSISATSNLEENSIEGIAILTFKVTGDIIKLNPEIVNEVVVEELTKMIKD